VSVDDLIDHLLPEDWREEDWRRDEPVPASATSTATATDATTVKNLKG